MLINLPLWRLESVKSRVIDLVKRKPEAIRFVDQCGLNSVVNGRWKELHPRFNAHECFFRRDTRQFATLFPEGEGLAAKENPIIIHYTGSLKPWSWYDDHPRKKDYWKYLSMTPYARTFPKDMTPLNILKRSIPKSIKRFFKR
jgi:lipopolysaccharide biosynthesis glycosyltransferase